MRLLQAAVLGISLLSSLAFAQKSSLQINAEVIKSDASVFSVGATAYKQAETYKSDINVEISLAGNLGESYINLSSIIKSNLKRKLDELKNTKTTQRNYIKKQRSALESTISAINHQKSAKDAFASGLLEMSNIALKKAINIEAFFRDFPLETGTGVCPDKNMGQVEGLFTGYKQNCKNEYSGEEQAKSRQLCLAKTGEIQELVAQIMEDGQKMHVLMTAPEIPSRYQSLKKMHEQLKKDNDKLNSLVDEIPAGKSKNVLVGDISSKIVKQEEKLFELIPYVVDKEGSEGRSDFGIALWNLINGDESSKTMSVQMGPIYKIFNRGVDVPITRSEMYETAMSLVIASIRDDDKKLQEAYGSLKKLNKLDSDYEKMNQSSIPFSVFGSAVAGEKELISMLPCLFGSCSSTVANTTKKLALDSTIKDHSPNVMAIAKLTDQIYGSSSVSSGILSSLNSITGSKPQIFSKNQNLKRGHQIHKLVNTCAGANGTAASANMTSMEMQNQAGGGGQMGCCLARNNARNLPEKCYYTTLDKCNSIEDSNRSFEPGVSCDSLDYCQMREKSASKGCCIFKSGGVTRLEYLDEKDCSKKSRIKFNKGQLCPSHNCMNGKSCPRDMCFGERGKSYVQSYFCNKNTLSCEMHPRKYCSNGCQTIGSKTTGKITGAECK